MLELSQSLVHLVGDEQAASSLDVSVIESDFNMGILPVERVEGNTLVTRVPGERTYVNLLPPCICTQPEARCGVLQLAVQLPTARLTASGAAASQGPP